MKWELRPFTAAVLAAGLVFGLSLASPLAYAEARQVGLPVGDLGNCVNGYSVVNPDGSETSVYCNDTRCVGEDGPAPARQVPKPSKAVIGALAANGQLSGATTGKQASAAGKPDPLDVIQGQ